MIFLVGDSHVNALRLGAQSLAERGELPQTDLRIGMLGNGKHALNEFSEVRDGRVVLTQADYAASLKRLTGDSHFLPADEASYAICLGFHSAPIFRHPLWRRYRPADLVTSPRTQRPVSSAALTAMVDHYNRYIYRLFERLVDASVDFFVVAAPPPRRDHRCLEESPAEVVLAVDAFFRKRVCQRLDAWGIRYILPPAEVFDDSGFLRQELANVAPRDFHHGNGQYGEMMIRAVLEPALTPQRA